MLCVMSTTKQLFFCEYIIPLIIDTLGSFFGPIFGVIIADYFLIKDKKIENKDIILQVLKDLTFIHVAGI